MTQPYDVIGLGNAMVDVLAQCGDDMLHDQGIQKGVMQLIDMDRAVDLYAAIGPAREISGGSAANTLAVLTSLGGTGAYIGKVRDDQLGQIFAHDLRAQGCDYLGPWAAADSAAETGRCIVLVTPDGERSMNTYLGASEHLAAQDLTDVDFAAAKWLYLEGYRFDGPDSFAAFDQAIAATRAGGGRIALTLSDPFCVGRHHAAFLALAQDHVDLLFCNRAELCALYVSDDLPHALMRAGADVDMVVCTDAENGVHIAHNGAVQHIPTHSVDIIDATGAGDAFAGAFLWGLCAGHTLDLCARMGNLAAGHIITQIGARAMVDLRQLYSDHGLI